MYIPYFVVLNLPYLNIPDGGAGTASMQLTACFPAWDAAIILGLITEYREAAIAMTPLKRYVHDY